MRVLIWSFTTPVVTVKQSKKPGESFFYCLTVVHYIMRNIFHQCILHYASAARMYYKCDRRRKISAW